jgi:hypothetical protein
MSKYDEGRESGEIEWIARQARRPVSTDPTARERLLAAIRAEPVPSRGSRFPGAGWWKEGRSWLMTPLATAALAAGLVGISIFAVHQRSESSRADQPIGQEIPVVSSMPAHPVSDSADTVRVFTLKAPGANHVAIVGDFNQWNVGATPMVRADHSGEWTVSVPLSAGRHTYAFVVNENGDDQWRADPADPIAADDGFGHANSVVLVSGSVGP